MAGKGEKVEPVEEQPAVEPLVAEVPVVEVQTKTYTQEELDAERESVRAEELLKYKGIQKTIAKKDQRIQELEGAQAPPASSNKTLSKVIEEMERRAGADYVEDPAAQSRISALKAELVREEQLQSQETTIKQKRLELNQKIADAGFDPSDDRFLEVDEAFDLATFDGKFERVDKRLARVLKSVKPVEEITPKETEAEKKEKYDKEVKEAARKMLEEKGQLVSDAGGPSAGGGSDDEFLEQYGLGKSDDHKRAKAIIDKLNKGA